MKSKGPKFNAMSAAMGGMGRKTGMSALAAGPLNQIKNIFGQPKQPTASSGGVSVFGQQKQPTAGGGVNVFGQQKQPIAGSMGDMGAMDQSGSQSIMGQDKIGCSDGMMSKSPLRAETFEYDKGESGLAGAYANPTTPKQSFTTTANGDVTVEENSERITSDGNTNADKEKVLNPAQQARKDGRDERALIRQTNRATRIEKRNIKRKKRTEGYQASRNRGQDSGSLFG